MIEQPCYWSDASTRNCVWLFQIRESELSDESQDFWGTERVFLLREEAREYGKARPYEWGEENKGWRIYGIPCAGLITDIIRKHTKEFDGKVDHIYFERCEVKVADGTPTTNDGIPPNNKLSGILPTIL